MEKMHGVRIGPSSLVTLISALLLAVLAMLCATSAHAQSVLAEREAEAATESYAIDSCGQIALAAIDAKLESGGTLSQADIEKIADEAQSQSSAGLSVTAGIKGNTASLTISAESGKTLNAKVSTKGGKASVEEWKMSTTQAENEETLWTK